MHASGTGVIMAQVEGVGIEAKGGADIITVHDLSNTSIDDVRINTGDILVPDGAEDQIFVEGATIADNIVVSSEDAALEPPGLNPPELGGITLMEFLPPTPTGLVPDYDVIMANMQDHVELATFAGEDRVEVHGISGPTWIETAEDADQIQIVAHTAKPPIVYGHSDFFAPLQVDAGSGANAMFFEVDAAPQLSQETVWLTDQTLTADQLIPEGVLFTATGGDYSNGIWLDTGSAQDTVYVQNTLPGVNTLVTTGAGADTLVLSSNPTGNGNLATIAGPLKVDAGSGGNSLRLDDRAATSGNAFVQVLGTSILGLAGPSDDIPVVYAATGGTFTDIRLDASNDPAVNETFRIANPNGSLRLYGRRGGERIDIETTLWPVEIRGGPGDDLINVGKLNTLDLIQGPVNVYGHLGADVLNVNDQDSLNGTTYALTNKTLDRLNAAQIGYYQLEHLNVNMTQHGDVVDADKIPWKTTVAFSDFGGNDYLFGPDKPAEFRVVGLDVGSLMVPLGSFQGLLEFSRIENLEGGAKMDRFVFVDGGSLSQSLAGGSGVDTLDYSGVTYAVRADLPAFSATSVGSVADVENVLGGPRNDVLIGDALDNELIGGPGDDLLLAGGGNDFLYGGTGNDLLAGHAGNDRLFGQLGQDVLIGGGDKDRLWGGEDDDALVGASTLHDHTEPRCLPSWRSGPARTWTTPLELRTCDLVAVSTAWFISTA